MLNVKLITFLSIVTLPCLFMPLYVLAERTHPVMFTQQDVPNDMVLIPAGVFQMGSANPLAGADEHPQHTVSLSAFYLDTYEVTNRQFRKFVKAKRYKTTAETTGKAWVYVEDQQWTEVSGAWWRKPEGKESVFASRRGSHPVVTVSWEDAKAYCEWAEKRLPTEAEWEYAARGGSPTNMWLGNKHSELRGLGNVADQTHKQKFPERPWPILEHYDDEYVRTAPVGMFEPNAWGLYDMIGNAWEWVADWYSEKYYSQSPRKNPQGPTEGHFKVLRGGSWATSPEYLGTGVRIFNSPTSRNAAHGFRCAKNVEKQ